MEATRSRATHPLMIIAAIAIILFCAAGVAAIMGWLPAVKLAAGAGIAALMLADSTGCLAVMPVVVRDRVTSSLAEGFGNEGPSSRLYVGNVPAARGAETS